MPERVQLSRHKGWRKPENTVVVARPTKWGNPYPVAKFGRELAVHGFRVALDEGRLTRIDTEQVRRELAGKNLACWCPLDQPCHADVLLEIANAAPDHMNSARPVGSGVQRCETATDRLGGAATEDPDSPSSPAGHAPDHMNRSE